MISFSPNDSIKDLLGFKPTTLSEEYNLSTNPVDILLFDKMLLATDIAQGMIYEGKRSKMIQNFIMDVDLGYKYIEKLRVGVQWFLMESKDFIPSSRFKLKNEIGDLISFNGQNITLRLLIKEA